MKTLVLLLLFVGSGNLLAQDAVPRNGKCPSGYWRDGNYCVLPPRSKTGSDLQREVDAENAARHAETQRKYEANRAREEQEKRDRCAASGFGYSQGKCIER